jgi:hypothetical protein
VLGIEGVFVKTTLEELLLINIMPEMTSKMAVLKAA